MASPYQKSGRWYLRIRDASGRWRGVPSEAKTKAEAKKLNAELQELEWRNGKGLEERQSDLVGTVAELCRWWLDERCPAPSKDIEKSRLLRTMSSPLGRVPLSAVRAKLFDAHLCELERAGAKRAALGPKSINNLRTTLRTVFTKARRAGKWAGENPLDQVERRRVPKKTYVILDAEELAQVLGQIPVPWRGVFAAGIWTSMRKGEIFGLLKTAVDLKHHQLTVGRSYARDTTKGDHADVIPVAPELLPYLEAAMRSPGELVFPASKGEMHSRHVKVELLLRRAMGRAGLVVGYDHICRRCKGAHRTPHTWRHDTRNERACPSCGFALWPKALPRPMRFHDLRHTGATLMLRAGIDPHRVQRVLRHRDVKTTTGTYGHLVVEDLREAVAAISGSKNRSFATRLLPDPKTGGGPGDATQENPSTTDTLPMCAQQDLNLQPLGSKPNALSS